MLDPGESLDAEHGRLLVIGTRDLFFDATRITVNRAEELDPMVFKHGEKYRLRLINMAPNLGANVQLGNKEHPATWRAAAKDGAHVPSRLSKAQDAVLHIASGEAYDFEFQPDSTGELPWQVENSFNKSKLTGKIIG